MDWRFALKRVRNAAHANSFRVIDYAEKRMADRGVSGADLWLALAEPTICFPQANGRWQVLGTNRDGEELKVIVEIGRSSIVVVNVL